MSKKKQKKRKIVLKGELKEGDDYLDYLERTSARQRKAQDLIELVYAKIRTLKVARDLKREEFWERDKYLDAESEAGKRRWGDTDDILDQLNIQRQEFDRQITDLWRRHDFLIEVAQAYGQRVFDELRKWDRRKTDQ